MKLSLGKVVWSSYTEASVLLALPTQGKKLIVFERTCEKVFFTFVDLPKTSIMLLGKLSSGMRLNSISPFLPLTSVTPVVVGGKKTGKF